MSLECKIDASPTPQVFWKKDKEMLRIDPSRMRLVLKPDILLNRAPAISKFNTAKVCEDTVGLKAPDVFVSGL